MYAPDEPDLREQLMAPDRPAWCRAGWSTAAQPRPVGSHQDAFDGACDAAAARAPLVGRGVRAEWSWTSVALRQRRPSATVSGLAGRVRCPGADPGLDPVQAAEVRADARRGGVASPMRSVAFRGSGEHHTVLMHSLPAAGSARHATVTRHRTSARAIVQDQSACLQASRPSRPLIYVVDDGSNRTQGACA